MKKALFMLLVGVVLWANEPARAGELLVNGGFESDWTNGWTRGYTQTPLGSIQNQTANVSPFANVDSAGTGAVELTAGSSTSGPGYGPGIFQYVTASLNYIFSFEFLLPDVTVGSPWEIGFHKQGTPIIDFMIGGYGGYGSSEAGHISYSTSGYSSTNYKDIASLVAGTCYQVTTVIDVNGNTYSGTLTPYQGTPFTFAGALAPGAANGRSVNIGTIDHPTGSVLYLDNVSIRQIPEPRIGELLVGFAIFLRRRFHVASGERREEVGLT